MGWSSTRRVRRRFWMLRTSDRTPLDPAEDALIRRALAEARETRALVVGAGVRHQVAELFEGQFGRVPALLVADPNTFVAAGRDVAASFGARGLPCPEPFVFTDPGLYAEDRFARQLQDALSGQKG